MSTQRRVAKTRKRWDEGPPLKAGCSRYFSLIIFSEILTLLSLEIVFLQNLNNIQALSLCSNSPRSSTISDWSPPAVRIKFPHPNLPLNQGFFFQISSFDLDALSPLRPEVLTRDGPTIPSFRIVQLSKVLWFFHPALFVADWFHPENRVLFNPCVTASWHLNF
jgi:hypothetical protein